MKINLKVMAIAVAMTIALTGCGGGGSSNSGTPSNGGKPNGSDTATETPGSKDDDKTTETTPEGATIVKPVKVEENVAKVENGAYRISFNQEKGDVVGTESDYQIRATIYQYDRYKVADLKKLKKGDQLYYHDSKAAWKIITIETVEFYQDEATINGGIESGRGIGFILENNLYVRSDMDHSIDCYKIGTKTLPVAADAVMTDDEYSFTQSFDTVTYTGAPAIYKIITQPRKIKGSKKGDTPRFNEYVGTNTTVTLKNGKIVKIHRNYLA